MVVKEVKVFSLNVNEFTLSLEEEVVQVCPCASKEVICVF